MGNTNFTMVMPTVQSFSAGGWSGGRAARKDYGTRSFGCKRDLCPFQVSGGWRARLAFSSFATAMARKLTTYVASRSSACLWDGWQVDARGDGRNGQYQLNYGYAHRPILQHAIGGQPTRGGGGGGGGGNLAGRVRGRPVWGRREKARRPQEVG